MASVTPIKLFSPAQLTTSAATYYTVPAGTKTVIKKLTLTNSTAGAVTATVYLVPSSGSAAATNIIVSARSLSAGETYEVTDVEGQIITAGDTIQMLAGSATSITAHGSGVQIVN